VAPYEVYMFCTFVLECFLLALAGNSMWAQGQYLDVNDTFPS